MLWYIEEMAILTFKDKVAEDFYVNGKVSKKAGWANLKKVVLRKLDMVSYAEKLEDLKSPPNNRLEELKGNLKGFYSIRINDQWRIIFKWTPAGAVDVGIVDYH